MKKLLPYILILLVVTGFFSSLHNVQAQEKKGICTTSFIPDTEEGCKKRGEGFQAVTPKDIANQEKVNESYHLLQPLPCIADETNADDCKNGLLTSFDPGGTGKLGVYLDFALKLFIGICAVAAVIMIVVGGIELSTSELISKKESAKERIWGAVLGLVLALTSWTILNTINPDLLRTDVDIQKSNLVSEGQVTIKDLEEKIITVGGQINAKNAGSVGTVCDANSIYTAAREGNQSLTEKEAAIFACILYFENRSCQNIKNYKWQQGLAGYSAFGIYQINLNGNWRAFEKQACYTSAEISGPLRCDKGFTNGRENNSTYFKNCIKAASNFSCQTAAAIHLLRNRQPPFADWTIGGKGESHANQANCVTKYK